MMMKNGSGLSRYGKLQRSDSRASNLSVTPGGNKKGSKSPSRKESFNAQIKP